MTAFLLAACTAGDAHVTRPCDYTVQARVSRIGPTIPLRQAWIVPPAYALRPHLAEPGRLHSTPLDVRTWIAADAAAEDTGCGCCEVYERPEPWLEPVHQARPFPPDWRAHVPSLPVPWTLDDRRRPGLRLRFR